MASSDGAPTSEIVNEQETLEMKTLDSTEAQRISGSEGSSVNNNGKEVAEGSGKTLEEASDLMEKGSAALKAADYAEAAECFSRAVEIRVAHYGELASKCSSAYYKYGCALLYKAQEEADPLGSVPKKDSSSIQGSENDGLPSKSECSASSATGDAKQAEDSSHNKGEPNDVGKSASEIDQTEADDDDDEGSEDEDLAEPDEDESDLDLAWKMLDLARAIVEKNPTNTMEKVDILSALGEVALEREDIESSLSDYSNALSILQCLVEPDSRVIAELNFRICLVLEVGSKPEEAIPYCQKAISICKDRLQRLTDEVKNSTVPVATAVVDDNQKVDQGSDVCHPDSSISGKEAEIETLSDLLGDLEKKLEDLQQLVAHPTPFLAEFFKRVAAKSTGNGASVPLSSSQMGANSSGSGFDSPTLSTAHSKGSADGPVQHLGVVGRGVKRVSMSSTSTDSGPAKKPLVEEGKDSAP